MVRAEDQAIGPRRQRLRRLVEQERADLAGARHGDQRQHEPVADEDRRDDDDLLPQRGAQSQQRRGDVGDADPLQHAEEAEVLGAVDDALPEGRIGIPGDLPPPEEREGVQQEADQDDEQSAPDDLAAHALRIALRQREVGRDADDE